VKTQDHDQPADENLVATIDKPTGCLMLLTLPFLLLGLYLVFGPPFLLVERPADAVLMLLCGLPFLGFGLWGTTARRGFQVNGNRRVVTRWRSLLLPVRGDQELPDSFFIRKKETPFAAFDRVTVREYISSSSGSGGSTSLYHGVRLEGGSRSPLIGRFGKFDDARRLGERLSRLCALPLVEFTQGQEVRRAPDQLDDSIRKQKRVRTRHSATPNRPATLLSTIQIDGPTVIVDLPAHGQPLIPRPAKHACLVLAAAVCLLIFVVAPEQIEFAAPVGVFLIFIWLLNTLLCTGGVKSQQPEWSRITASPDSLIVTGTCSAEPRQGVIRVDDIEAFLVQELPEDLQCLPWPFSVIRRLAEIGSVIVAQTDQHSISFGKGLPLDELQYLHALLYEALTAQPAARLAP
jgi:hypothetical protein